MWSPIRYSGCYGCLCISYIPLLVIIFVIIAPYPYRFMEIKWDLICRFSESYIFTLMFLTLFSLSFSPIYGRAHLYK